MKTKLPKYDKYKPSGVEWLGEIPEHWEVKRLKSFSKIVNGATPSSSILSYWDGNVTWVTPTDINNINVIESSERTITEKGLQSCGTSLVPKGSVILTTRAPIGKLVIAGVELCTNQGCKSIVIDKANISNSFVYFILLICNAKLNSLGTGTTFMELSNKELKNFQLPIPPLSEQTRIAEFLDRKTAQIDQAIGIKEKQIALLKERRQLMIHRAVTRGINPDIKLKPSGVEWIGDIPEHWEVKKLKYILKSQGRIGFKGYTTSDLVEKGQGALTLGATHLDWNGNINLSAPVYISWKKYYESPEIMVSKNDIIIVQRGSTCGKVALIKDELGATTINPSLVLLKSIIEDPEYVFLGIKVVLNGILNLVSTTAIPMLSQFQINSIEIAVPPINEQKQIVLYIEGITQKIATAISLKEQEIGKLKEYKSVLINGAVTGKVKVG